MSEEQEELLRLHEIVQEIEMFKHTGNTNSADLQVVLRKPEATTVQGVPTNRKTVFIKDESNRVGKSSL